MRVIDQAIINRVFAVTDEIELDREAIQVPLAMQGKGAVRALGGGRFEITLPDSDDLDAFLRSLPQRLRRAGFEAGS